MAKTTTAGATPRLRFPEFLATGPWETRLAGALFSNHVEPGEDGLPIYSVTMNDGLVKRSSLDRHVDDIAEPVNNKRARRNDVVYNTMRMWQGAFGIAVEDCMVSPAYVVLTPLADVLPEFVGHLLKAPASLQRLNNQSHGLTKDRLRLYYRDFAQIPLAVPPLPEQRKIANCLTSLDELIAAQARKVEALKAHKRGLLQRLFPREGETVPRLRFPEFRGGADWTVVPLGELLQGKPKYGVNAPAVPYSADLPTYLRITDIDEDGQYIAEGKASVDIPLTDDDYMKEGDIALARTGASVGKSYRYRPEHGRLVFAGFLIRIRPDQNRVDPNFLSTFFTTDRYWNRIRSTSARSGQPGVNGSEYAALPVPIPPQGSMSNELTEQQRIGDCLGALDAAIAAATSQLSRLRRHKEGLLQQLFPSFEG